MALRLWPLSRADLISGQRFRIWAALVGGFFSRSAARRVRAFSRMGGLTTLYDGGQRKSTSVNRIQQGQQLSTEVNVYGNLGSPQTLSEAAVW